MSAQPTFLPPGALAALAADDIGGLLTALGEGGWRGGLGPAGEPAGFWAVKMGALECLGEWERRWGSEWAAKKDARGRSAAHWAIPGMQQSRELTLEWLAARGVGLDEPDAMGMTPLGLALAMGHHGSALAMVGNGWADPNAVCLAGLRPLEALASLRSGSDKLAEALIDAGASQVERLAGPMAGMPLDLALAAALWPKDRARLEARALERSAGEALKSSGAARAL